MKQFHLQRGIFTVAIVIGFSLLASGITFAQPANDTCASAQAIGEGTFDFDTTGSAEDGPNDCQTELSKDVWFLYTASADGNVWISTCGSEGTLNDTVIIVYEGANCPSDASTCMGADDDDHCSSPGEGSIVVIAVAEGGQYYIQVGGDDGASGDGQLSVSFAHEEDCHDGYDNDLDGIADCMDSDCADDCGCNYGILYCSQDPVDYSVTISWNQPIESYAVFELKRFNGYDSMGDEIWVDITPEDSLSTEIIYPAEQLGCFMRHKLIFDCGLSTTTSTSLEEYECQLDTLLPFGQTGVDHRFEYSCEVTDPTSAPIQIRAGDAPVEVAVDFGIEWKDLTPISDNRAPVQGFSMEVHHDPVLRIAEEATLAAIYQIDYSPYSTQQEDPGFVYFTYENSSSGGSWNLSVIFSYFDETLPLIEADFSDPQTVATVIYHSDRHHWEAHRGGDYFGPANLQFMGDNLVVVCSAGITPVVNNPHSINFAAPDQDAKLFRRGDCNASGDINLVDAVAILQLLFQVGPATNSCQAACDFNGDLQFNLVDPVAALVFLMGMGPGPLGYLDPADDSMLPVCDEDLPGSTLSCDTSHPDCSP